MPKAPLHLDGPGQQMPLVSTGIFERNALPDEALALLSRELLPPQEDQEDQTTKDVAGCTTEKRAT